jgi:hypothetical protein
MKKASCLVLVTSLLLLSLAGFASANPHHFGPVTVTVVSPVTEQVYDQSNIHVNVKVDMGGYPAWVQLSWMKCNLDGQFDLTLNVTNEAVSGGYEGYGTGILSNLPNGPHSLYINGETNLTSPYSPSSPYESFEETVYFVVGSFTPTIQVKSPQPKTYDSTSVSLQFLSNKHMDWTGYSLDQNPPVACQSPTTLGNLSNGQHRLRVYGKGVTGGACASEKIVFSINGKKPPTVTIDIPAILHAMPYLPSDFQDMTYWKLYFHTSEPSFGASYSLDGGGIQGTSNGSILRLTYGMHTIIVHAKDVCGNDGVSEPYTFTLGPGEAGSAYPSHTPRSTNGGTSHPTNSTHYNSPGNPTPSASTRASLSAASSTQLEVPQWNSANVTLTVIGSLLVSFVLSSILVFWRHKKKIKQLNLWSFC